MERLVGGLYSQNWFRPGSSDTHYLDPLDLSLVNQSWFLGLNKNHLNLIEELEIGKNGVTNHRVVKGLVFWK